MAASIREVTSRDMDAADRWAKARGAAEIELTVWDFNRDATGLYESLGRPRGT